MYQIPPLSNEYVFEDFICDLFNEIEKTNNFQNFGVKGQNQKGIDIIFTGSTSNRTVIQCKKKDITKSDELNRKALIDDIKSDFEKTKELNFEVKRFILVSTYKNDNKIQEYTSQLSEEGGVSVEYWGWETIVKALGDCPRVLSKYYPHFKLEAKEILLNFEVWEQNGEVGFDYSYLFHGINKLISLLGNSKELPNKANDLIRYMLNNIDSSLKEKGFHKGIDDQFGFGKYVNAAINQAIKSLSNVSEQTEKIISPEKLGESIIKSFSEGEFQIENYNLVFFTDQHPAVKFVKETVLKLMDSTGINDDVKTVFIRDFNQNIESSVIEDFGQNEYKDHLQLIRMKWLKENEIKFLTKMQSLGKIGFADGENMQYQETYGYWEEIKRIRFLGNEKTETNKQLKPIVELIAEYYNNLEKINKIREKDHNFDSILFIIADFGKGKSSFIKHHASQLASNYLRTGEGFFPVYFNLNEFSKYPAFHNLGVIGSYLEREFSIQVNDSYYKKKKYIFLIDSLDESGELNAGHIDNVIESIKLIHNIDPANCRDNRIVITSRPFENGLSKHLSSHSPFEQIDEEGDSVAKVICINGFKPEQFNNYVVGALQEYWNKNQIDETVLLEMPRSIYGSIKKKEQIDLYSLLLDHNLLKHSELQRPIFAYMIYSLLKDNIDFKNTGKIGVYISFLNKLTKEAKMKDDSNYNVKLLDEFKFRNLLHNTAALWQFKRQQGDQGFLKKADICRVVEGIDESKSDSEVLSHYSDIDAIRFLSHSYLGENEDTFHFHHQSFAEILLAEYYLKVFIKFGIEPNSNIEEAKKHLLLGIPTNQTIEFLKGLLELLQYCSEGEPTDDIIEKRRLLAPILASLSTSEYSRKLFSERLVARWFEDINIQLKEKENIRQIPNKFLMNWPIQKPEIDRIVNFCIKIIENETNFLFSRGDQEKVLIGKEIIKIRQDTRFIPPNIDKWISLLAGNCLIADEVNTFTSRITHVETLFDLMRNWNYYGEKAAPSWGKKLFRGIKMVNSKEKVFFKGVDFSEIDFSYSRLANLNFSYCVMVKSDFSNSTIENVNINRSHLPSADFSSSKIIRLSITCSDIKQINFKEIQLGKLNLELVTIEQGVFLPEKLGQLFQDIRDRWLLNQGGISYISEELYIEELIDKMFETIKPLMKYGIEKNLLSYEDTESLFIFGGENSKKKFFEIVSDLFEEVKSENCIVQK